MSFDQFSLFDAFDAFGTQEEVKEEVKETTVVAPAASEEKEVAETKAAVNVTEGGVSFEDFSAFSSVDEEDDGEDLSLILMRRLQRTPKKVRAHPRNLPLLRLKRLLAR